MLLKSLRKALAGLTLALLHLVELFLRGDLGAEERLHDVGSDLRLHRHEHGAAFLFVFEQGILLGVAP